MDTLNLRQRILLNQPHIETISNNIVSFNTDMVAPMKNCKIYFKPIQLGTGDPSPTNVRNINGWTSVDSYVNGDKISVDWTSDVGTVYGGYLDLAKGEVVAEWAGKPINSFTWTYNSSGICFRTLTNIKNKSYGTISPVLSNIYKTTNAGNTMATWANYDDFSISEYTGVDNNGNRKDAIHIKDSRYTTVSDFLNGVGNESIIYELAEPIHYSLTSQQLLTLKSTNNIWSETNRQQIDITYWTRKNLIPTPLTDYLENQTWTDSAYISSSGKKTTNTVSASHFLTNQILLEAGTYVLSGFSYYAGSDSTRYRIHAYDSAGKWVKQITFQEIGNLSPVDISFTLDTDTYVNVSIAMDFDGVLAKIN